MIDIKRQEEAFEKACINKQYIKLGNCAKFSKGKNVSKSDIVENGKYPAIRYGELYTKYEENITNVVSTVDSDENLIKSKIGDILIPSSGETAIDLATASCILLDNVIIGGDINIIDVDRKQIDPVYLSYYINSKLKYNVAKLAQGISVIHIYNSELKGLQLSIPELYMQNKATNFLTSLDSLIQKQEEYIEELKLQKKGYSQKLFSQKLRFEGFDKKWKVDTLSKYVDILKGIFGASKEDFEAKDFNAKYIQFKNIHKTKIKEEELGTIKLKNLSSQNNIKKDDIVVTTSSENIEEVGTTNINKLELENLYLNSFSFGLRPNNINADFLHYQLKEEKVRKKIMLKGQGITRINLSANKFVQLEVDIPELDEQIKISNFLNVLDRKIELQEKKLEQLKIKKNYYLSAIFQ